jgi:hypothetical protein
MTAFSFRLFKPLFVPILFTAASLQFAYALPPGQTNEVPKTEDSANTKPTSTDEEDRALLSTITFPDDMVGTVFAREPNVQDPTAISIDEKNRVYIAETHRFARGVEDNRRNGHWVRDDIGSTSTADRLAMYKKICG